MQGSPLLKHFHCCSLRPKYISSLRWRNVAGHDRAFKVTGIKKTPVVPSAYTGIRDEGAAIAYAYEYDHLCRDMNLPALLH